VGIGLVGGIVAVGEVAHTPAEEVHRREAAHIDLEAVLVVAHNLPADNLGFAEADRIGLEEAGRMEVGQEEHRNLAVEGDIDCMEVEENVLAAAGHHIHHTEVVDMPS
jgi:hypothetical protein